MLKVGGWLADIPVPSPSKRTSSLGLDFRALPQPEKVEPSWALHLRRELEQN